jgi:hypothetical protein
MIGHQLIKLKMLVNRKNAIYFENFEKRYNGFSCISKLCSSGIQGTFYRLKKGSFYLTTLRNGLRGLALLDSLVAGDLGLLLKKFVTMI